MNQLIGSLNTQAADADETRTIANNNDAIAEIPTFLRNITPYLLIVIEIDYKVMLPIYRNESDTNNLTSIPINYPLSQHVIAERMELAFMLQPPKGYT
ncbi:hypothetical protein PCCS19_06730 [Paenibacillus sp. CCS19]|nr:hypothetical protein PCCS19_06730 [Paenibacillus cellulosilyticus]